MDSSNDGKVEMFFLPWIVQRGHMIPAIDTARVFAAHGAKVTIITTPGYAQLFQKSIERDQSLGHEISFHTFKLPTAEFGLPEGCENLLAGSLGMMEKLCLAIQKLQQPIEQFIRERRPDCIVSDMFHPWTADVGARLAVPRFLLYVTGLFSLSLSLSLCLCLLYKFFVCTSLFLKLRFMLQDCSLFVVKRAFDDTHRKTR
ncbi:hypothetical protein CsSME_00017558 [Camellia sinensis var. sinensis]